MNTHKDWCSECGALVKCIDYPPLLMCLRCLLDATGIQPDDIFEPYEISEYCWNCDDMKEEIHDLEETVAKLEKQIEYGSDLADELLTGLDLEMLRR